MKKNKLRNQKIINDFLGLVPNADTAKDIGLTPERIRQVIKQCYGWRMVNLIKAIRASLRTATEKERVNDRRRLFYRDNPAYAVKKRQKTLQYYYNNREERKDAINTKWRRKYKTDKEFRDKERVRHRAKYQKKLSTLP